MKKLLCVLIILAITVNLAACGLSNPFAKDDPKLLTGVCGYYSDGGLSYFTEYSYEYDSDGNLVKECEYRNGYINTTGDLVYDPSGSYTESVRDYRDNPLSEAEYDKNGNLTSETIYEFGKIRSHTEFDENGSPVFKEAYYGDTYYTVEYEYDESGKLYKEKETDHDESGSVTFRYEDLYDPDGNMIQRTIFGADGIARIVSRTEIIKEGNTTTLEEYGESGALRYRTVLDHDDAGNVISQISYDVSDGSILSSEEYSYDEKGRVIEYIYTFRDRTVTEYEYSDEGYLFKETISTQRWLSDEAYGDGSDATLRGVVTVNQYDADGDILSSHRFVDGVLSGYTEYYYEHVDIRPGAEYDYRDDSRVLDPRSTVVY
ncbi:MAG: hypothetical protein J6X94_05215 [Lachnospiraceae bacterium]|nr:hypothetical protein [Lachnospiraceae bacterium]